jgi:DNA-binding MarR family transcriptional regulator
MKNRDLDDCPYYLITRASLLMRSTFKKSFGAAGIGRVQPAFLVVLFCLWKKEGQKMIELARASGLEPSTMTGLLDRMEREGFVTRVPDPDDRRVQKIMLTDSGRKVRKTVEKMVDETLELLFLGIPEEEVDHTNVVLRKLIENAREGGAS